MLKKLFGTKTKTHDEFPYLQTYENKDKYFVRTATWDWLNKKEIYVVKKQDNQLSTHTMDFWLQEIFLDANGQITVAELIEIACKQFRDSNMKVPANVDEYLIGELDRLVNELNIVEFKDQKTELPDLFNQPMSKQLKSPN